MQMLALAAQAVCWLRALRYLPLSRAYPGMSLSLVLNFILAFLCFGEQFGLRQGTGALMLVAGSALVLIDKDRDPANARA